MSDPDDYREMARRLRVHAAMMKSREARADLRWLAAEYEAQAAQEFEKGVPAGMQKLVDAMERAAQQA